MYWVYLFWTFVRAFFIRRADGYLPGALCIRSSPPQRSEDPAHQRYRQAHSRFFGLLAVSYAA